MDFGSWDKTIHEDEEQLKRISTAKKADTTPANIDHSNKTAEFKGSGKKPYITTLDSCSCGDFIKRRLPCKHIYRLALELEGIDVKIGMNKNERKELIQTKLSSLSLEAQSLLFDMAYVFIGRGLSVFFINRTEHSESLVTSGLCTEHFDNYTAYADYHNKDRIINVLRHTHLDGIFPAKNIRKTELHELVSELEKNRLSELQREIILLELSEEAQVEKHVLHRNLYKVFYNSTLEDKQRRLDELLEKGLITKDSYNQRLEFLD